MADVRCLTWHGCWHSGGEAPAVRLPDERPQYMHAINISIARNYSTLCVSEQTMLLKEGI